MPGEDEDVFVRLNRLEADFRLMRPLSEADRPSMTRLDQDLLRARVRTALASGVAAAPSQLEDLELTPQRPWVGGRGRIGGRGLVRWDASTIDPAPRNHSFFTIGEERFAVRSVRVRPYAP